MKPFIRKNSSLKWLVAFAAICAATTVWTFTSMGQVNSASSASTVSHAIESFQPGVVVENVTPAPMTGWYQANIGSQVLYVSDDGRYAMSGTLLDLKEHRNLTEVVQAQKAASILANVGKAPLHVYEPKGKVAGRIYVFTDPTCSYCAKLHKDVPELQARGIEVVYLAFPRGGAESEGYAPLAAAVCSEDRSDALNRAFAGGAVEAAPCPNSLLDHYRAGEHLQLTGTPGIFAADGRQIGGYLAPDQMLVALAGKPGQLAPRGSANGQ